MRNMDFKLNPLIFCKGRSIDEINYYLCSMPLYATYRVKGNAVSQDVCDMRVRHRPGHKRNMEIEVHLGNGNHPKQFNEVEIMTADNILVARLYYSYDEYDQGYGTLDKKLHFCGMH